MTHVRGEGGGKNEFEGLGCCVPAPFLGHPVTKGVRVRERQAV